MPKSQTVFLWKQIVSALLILPLSFLSIFAVIRVPSIFLWKLAIGVIEWGYVVAILLFVGCFLCDLQTTWGKFLLTLGVVASLFVLSPWVRAGMQADSVAKGFSRAFGETKMPALGAGGQDVPLALGRLFTGASANVKKTRFDVPIKSGLSLPLDLYQSQAVKTPRPLLFVIHGGSWQSGDLEQLSGVNSYFAGRGLHVAAISYRLSPNNQFPTHLNDVTTMAKWLIENAKKLSIDTNNIFVMGRSAGGHLALLSAYEKIVPNIRGVISFYAPTDLHWSWAHPTSPWILDTLGSLTAFLGGSPEKFRKLYDNASPIQKVTSKSTPTLLIHGTRDELVSVKQAHRLSAVLEKNKVKHYFLELPWATHGCEVSLGGPSGQLSVYVIERFIAALLISKSAPKNK